MQDFSAKVIQRVCCVKRATQTRNECDSRFAQNSSTIYGGTQVYALLSMLRKILTDHSRERYRDFPVRKYSHCNPTFKIRNSGCTFTLISCFTYSMPRTFIYISVYVKLSFCRFHHRCPRRDPRAMCISVYFISFIRYTPDAFPRKRYETQSISFPGIEQNLANIYVLYHTRRGRLRRAFLSRTPIEQVA